MSYDEHLAAYHRGTVTVWCERKECELHFDGIEVDTETEYGQTTCRPEECPVCHGSWLYDEPPLDEDEVNAIAKVFHNYVMETRGYPTHKREE